MNSTERITDGDVLFSETTSDVEIEALNPVALGALTSEAAWDVVLSRFQD